MKNDGEIAEHDNAADLTGLTQDELIETIRFRLGGPNGRRVTHQHTDVLKVLLGMGGQAGDVNEIYRTLMLSGRDMGMSQLYRVIRVLEEARLIESRWVHHGGSPRRVFNVAGQAKSADVDQPTGVCQHCGAPLHCN